ncbi:LINE-1 reverse transcriptase like, partial [Trifolium medium]|nr:LINE-1 reverse transcriptase like [Trifolium medium]
MGFILKEKLKSIKGVIKEWNALTYGEVEEKKKLLIKGIADLDLKSEVSGLVEEEVVERKKLFEDLWVLLKNVDSLDFQRSRYKWLKEGDSNSHPTLDGIDFPLLAEDKVEALTAIFTMEELTEVVKGCDGSKSPRPDGFNFAFIKEFWYLMKGEVRIMFDQFH